MMNTELLIGRDGKSYVTLEGQESVIIGARTGAGKDVSFAIPNCFLWPGSLVVFDPKGELYRKTAGHRYHVLGQDIYVFNPSAPDFRSHRWNPLDQIQRDTFHRFKQIGRQANVLFPEIDQIGMASNSQKFWDDVGRQALSAVITILAEIPTSFLNMEKVSSIFRRSDGPDMLKNFIVEARQKNTPFSQMAIDGISDYVSRDAKLRSEISKTTSARLQLWNTPEINAVTEHSDFNLADLRRRPMTIYVTPPPSEIEWLRPLLRLFFDQVLRQNTDEMPADNPDLNVPLLIVMNEFARLGRVDVLAQAPQYVRDYGIRMMFLVQTKAQIESIYGKPMTSDLFDNMGAKIFFGSDDPDMTQELENRMGDDTIMFTTTNRPRFFSWFKPGKHGESDHPHRRPLMYDHEIAQMSPDRQLIIRPGMRPMETDRIIWYQDPHFTTLLRDPPAPPRLVIRVPIDDGSLNIDIPTPLLSAA